jgi:uncharacterized protein (DUF1330 family)
MTAYAVAQITITNREAYGRYQAAFMEVLRKHGGKLLAADEAPQVVEGTWDHGKIVIIAFPDEETLRRWATSPEYQAISRDRKAGTHGVSLLVQGV